MSSGYVEVSLIPRAFTKSGLAVWCDCGGNDDVCLPLSQFETPPELSDRGEAGVYEISEWICNDKGLI